MSIKKLVTVLVGYALFSIGCGLLFAVGTLSASPVLLIVIVASLMIIAGVATVVAVTA